jgi:hypothetical protein
MPVLKHLCYIKWNDLNIIPLRAYFSYLFLGESSAVIGNQTAVIPLTMDNVFAKTYWLKAHPFFLE